MSKNKNSKEVIQAGTHSWNFKTPDLASKHVESFLNALSGNEKFTVEMYSASKGVQVSCSVHEKK